VSSHKETGASSFEARYSALYEGRWPSLRTALLEERLPDPYAEGLASPYYLDRASVWAAQSLDLSGRERILDMCAAPGGKSLVLASRMGEAARLTCNERSGERRARLVRVLDEHLGPGLRQRVLVLGQDAATLCRREREAYDAILLDAPCSSEAHVLRSPAHLAKWSPARIKSLAMAQWALLSSAVRLLAPGGSLVYSTCALSPEENESQIDRLLRRYGDSLRAEPPLALGGIEGEPRGQGALVLPDRSGYGPLFVARLRLVSALM
jgi:16S rRNA C967 or C1407 C5-methylase (RsmB/RsmF family)